VRVALQVLAFSCAAAFVLVFAVEPHSNAALASQEYAPTINQRYGGTQDLAIAGVNGAAISRDSYGVTDPPPPPPVQPAAALRVSSDPTASSGASSGSSDCTANVVPTPGLPDPGSLQDIAYQAVMGYGWGEQNYYYLLALWNRESGWNPTASNPSGAYGIPQALPGSKMGPGWESDPNVQINWGLQYIASQYGTPCEAWASSESRGWY
jgi:hypothetical protein